MKTTSKILLATLIGAMVAGCATNPNSYSTNPDTNDRTRNGALIGAAVGAAAGVLSGDDAVERRQRALVGAGVGALAGGAIGNYQDRQERALRDRLQGTGVGVVRQGDNIVLTMPDAITFSTNSSALQPQFRPVLDNLASTLTQYNQTVINVAGHTDQRGDASYNLNLSQQRAESVAGYLNTKGVTRDRMVVVGRGETQLLCTENTESCWSRNRRVEITLVPLRQG
ncbi:OmpA family protein [Lysobacter sp. TY2-98]|uniref:OmpA family protein n=1 Tax=Lysobacter sp. TY2-98 TaxID=2290922 RepID=UPI000E205630|nr:OmpA family protein [Lysobacter sp. TY2-98]AXK71837.1 OmpA family protein [Lysobacter sp. TY2-98]